MNVLLLFLLIPVSFALDAPDCKEMGKILEKYEMSIQKDSIKDCKDDTYKSLVKNIPEPLNPEFLKGKACQDLATIELQLNQLQVELSVLDGINKLVETVKTTKDNASDKRPEVARQNAHKFIDSLNIAQSLEVLLASKTEDGKSFMEALKEFPKNKLSNENELKERVKELCGSSQKKDQDACNPKLFIPRKIAGEEIIGIIQNTGDIKGNLDRWKNQLAIKRKDKDKEAKKESYTFTKMQEELAESFVSMDEKSVMSKDQLKAIQALDEFEFDDKFSFVQDIKGLRDQKKNKTASDKFFLLMGDAQKREEFHVQSKLSIVWNDVRNHVPMKDEEKKNCDAAKNSYGELLLCAEALKKALPNVTESLALPKLKSFIPAMTNSIEYINKMENKQTSCRQEIKEKEVLTEACFAEFNRDRAKVQDQILQLNLVKEKIGAQNVDNMLFRNFALEKWTTQKCSEKKADIEFCEDISVISKDAALTINDAMKISVLYSRSEKEISEAEKRVEPLCRDGSRKRIKSEDQMCEFFYLKDKKPILNDLSKEAISGPVAAPDGKNEENKIRDAWIQGSTDVLRTLLPAFNANQMSPYLNNPYPYNYSPYGTGIGPMGISDTILFNARYYGAYGYYMPTPGYQPYTAFGVNSPLSTYKPISSPSTQYFYYK
jgi:hypothetical protein